MGRWWNTEMMSTSQALYGDTSMAMDTATTPDSAFQQSPLIQQAYSQEDYDQDKESVQEKRSGFLGWISGIGAKADDVANSVTGGAWDKVQDNVLAPVGKAVWYPIDKLATGAHWLYSNAISRPLSTLLQVEAQAALDMDPTKLFSGEAWTNAYDEAEHLSPGQVITNSLATGIARGDIPMGALGYGFKDAQDIVKNSQIGKDAQTRNTARMIQDTDYWRDKAGWRYTLGSGAVDFISVMALDPSTYLTAGVAGAVKGARTVKFTEQGGQLVRDQGKVINTAKRLAGKQPQTVEEVSSGKRMQDFFDWTQQASVTGAARKTQAEIAAHPIFDGGFRRGNPARNQIASLFANSAREDMPAIYRYAAGDASAATELMAKGSSALDDIGRIGDNRKLVDSVKFDPEMLAYFASKEGARVAGGATLKAPAMPLTQEAALTEEAARAVMSGGTKFKVSSSGTISKRFAREADQWKADKLSMIDQEMVKAGGIGEVLRTALGSNLGKSGDEFTTAVESAHLFGSLPSAYKMGTGTFRSTEKVAERKFARQIADRKGVFSTEGFRKGFYGTPVRVLQSFGDRTPIGRINHNDADAGDRVMDMLKQVPALGGEARATLLNKYLTAGDKVAKSRALDEIHTEVLNHMVQRVHNLTPELSEIIGGMVKAGTESIVNKLISKTVGSSRFGTNQRFSTAVREGEDRTVDMVEDGVGWSASPLAKTQLSQTDSLLPVRELNRVLGRNSGAMRFLTSRGGKAVDVGRTVADSFNVLWKGATLLRPAYTVRMVSEELAAAAVKFGFMSHFVAGGSKGATNFVLNRAQHIGAEIGLGSYAPSTGKGLSSRFSVVSLGDDAEIAQKVASRQAALGEEIAAHAALPKNPRRVGELKAELAKAKPARKKQIKQELKGFYDQATYDRLVAERAAIKTKRIRVNKALPVIDARIKMERELLDGVDRDLARYTKELESHNAKIAEKGETPKRVIKREQLEARIAGIQDQAADHTSALDEFTDYSNYVLQRAIDATGRRVGEGTFQYRGMTIPQAFARGEEGWANPISRAQFDAEGDVAASSLISRAEALDTERLIKSGNWDSIQPTDPNHMDSWLRALNYQFGQDEGFRLAMQDGTGDALRAFLKTPEGKAHMKDVGSAAKDPEAFADGILATIDKYLPEQTGLRAKLLEGKQVTKADLQRSVSAADYPVVHGEEVLEKTSLWGKTTSGHIVDTAIRKGFERMGQIPQSVMSRNPVYIQFQEARMKSLIDDELRVRAANGKDEALTHVELETLMHKSDKLARKDMSQIVYDPMRTSASESLRFIAPFFSAHADGLTRWSGLIAEKPQYAGRIAQIYNAPVAANMITDAQGNVVGMDGMTDVRDPSTGKIVERKFVPIQDRVFQLRAPWADKSKGSVPIKIQAMNTILPGDPWWNPGSGPLVQIAGSQIAKASPTAGDFLQWSKVLPYGPSGSMTDAITPKYMRALWDAYQGDDPNNEEYQKAYLAIWNKKQAEYLTGSADFAKQHPNATQEEREQALAEYRFNLKDVEEEAKNFLMLNVLEAWASPAQSSNTPLTGTPYQFYVDQLAQLKKADPESAADKFLAMYPEYFGFTASLNKSIGIAATISADQQAEKYKDEIAADPDMAAFWIGDIYNGGPFSSTVYSKQFGQNFGAEMAREKIPAEKAIENVQISTGWDQYRAAKLGLDSLLIRNGFKSYSESGAEQINAARQQVIAGISQAFPAWGEAFSTTDRAKIPNRIEAFSNAVNDEKLANDPMRREISVLRQYLIGRQQFKAALAARGGKQLSYSADGATPIGDNADIGYAWQQFRMGLANSNIAFNELMNRYLSNDDLQ